MNTRYQKDTERNFKKSSSGYYGNSEIMGKSEKKETLCSLPIEKQLDNFIGTNPDDPDKLCSIRDRYGINKNKVVIAGPGGGKTRAININDVFQIIRRGESAIITDPKGDIFKITSELAKKNGYVVRIFNINPDYMENSDCCHFFKSVKNAKTENEAILRAQLLADAIIKNTLEGERKDYWAKNEQSLLTGEILRVSLDDSFYENEKTIGHIYTRTTTLDANGLAADYVNLKTVNPDHPALNQYNTFANTSKENQGQIINGLSIRLQIFASDVIRKITGSGGDEIDFTLPGKRKCIYYVSMSDQTKAMSFLSAMFLSLACQELVSYADKFRKQCLPITTWLILEEFYNSGIIPEFENKISTMRSRGISCSITLQNLPQMEQMYPDKGWESIIDCCDTYLLLKTNTKTTMDFFSELSGIETTFMKNRKYVENELDPLKIHLTSQVSEGLGQRPVLLPNDVRMISSKSQILCVSSGHNVCFFDKYDYSNHPMAKKIDEIHPGEHYPRYRLLEDGVIDESFSYDEEPTIRMKIEFEDDKYYAEYKDEKYNPKNYAKPNAVPLPQKTSNTLTKTQEQKSYIVQDLDKLLALKESFKKLFPDSIINYLINKDTAELCQVTIRIYENASKSNLLTEQTTFLFQADYRNFKTQMGDTIPDSLTLKETAKKLALYTALVFLETKGGIADVES